MMIALTQVACNHDYQDLKNRQSSDVNHQSMNDNQKYKNADNRINNDFAKNIAVVKNMHEIELLKGQEVMGFLSQDFQHILKQQENYDNQLFDDYQQGKINEPFGECSREAAGFLFARQDDLSEEFINHVINTIKYTMTKQGNVQVEYQNMTTNAMVVRTFYMVEENGTKVDEIVDEYGAWKKDLKNCLTKQDFNAIKKGM